MAPNSLCRVGLRKTRLGHLPTEECALPLLRVQGAGSIYQPDRCSSFPSMPWVRKRAGPGTLEVVLTLETQEWGVTPFLASNLDLRAWGQAGEALALG